MSAYSATVSTSVGDMTSVMMGRPDSCLARSSSLRPSRPMPRKLYGEVRGLNAPPRSTVAPAALTALAVDTICSSSSTEQGPAMMTGLSPPTKASPTLMVVGSGWNSRLASL